MIHSWITMSWTKRIDRCILKVHHVGIVNIGWPCWHVTIIKFWRCPNRDLPWLTAVKTVVKWYRLEIKQDNLSSSLIDSCFVFNLISSHGNDSNKILHLTIYKIIPFLFHFFLLTILNESNKSKPRGSMFTIRLWYGLWPMDSQF